MHRKLNDSNYLGTMKNSTPIRHYATDESRATINCRDTPSVAQMSHAAPGESDERSPVKDRDTCDPISNGFENRAL